MAELLEQVVQSWHPTSRSVTRTVVANPLTALADALDQSVPIEEGAPVPLLWHWMVWTESCPQRSLGPDGHPAEGHFLPPFPDRRRMMAGGRVRQQSALQVGATYRRDSELVGATVKHGRSGAMLFTTVRHTFHDSGGTAVLMEEEDVVYRQQIAGEGRLLASAEDGPGSTWHRSRGERGQLAVTADSRLLFRFSALTYNSHRIHYDEPYATGEEGYPGLVVHGPLLALLMLELPRRAGYRPTMFDYRLSRPTFVGNEVVATWDGDELGAGMAGAASPSATATVAV